MSVKAMAWAWEQDVSGNDKLVLLALADWARDDGLCWPGLRQIAEKTRISVRATSNVVARLEGRGMLRKEKRAGDGDGRKPDLLWLQMGNMHVVHVGGGQSAQLSTSSCAQEDALGQGQGQPSEGEVASLPPSPMIPTKVSQQFEAWLEHHEHVTGHRPPGTKTKARKTLLSSFNARVNEGWSLDELKAATVGAHSDDYRRENGYDTPTSILRPTKVGDLVARGRARSRTGTAATPITVEEMERQARERILAEGRQRDADAAARRAAEEKLIAQMVERGELAA